MCLLSCQTLLYILHCMLFIKLEYHNVFHHTSYIYTYKVNPIVLERMRAIIDIVILQGRQVLTDGLTGYKRPGQ